jgi:hypothetical protein
MGTSRARRRLIQLNVVESIPEKHESQEPSPPAESSEVPQPDSADQADLDAALTGMSLLLHLALRLMKSSGASRR